ncbi:hypothetical protein XENOCAPTIV_018749 [Xenoophorus captivus]|uniref:Uncharacterized protein n=1 Tax=Xenoophorus captivus TaxID=1517983 RepID=A0ABV0QBJ5_9TELE
MLLSASKKGFLFPLLRNILHVVFACQALVSFPDLELAEEIVKVHSFKPAMFKNIEVKMSLVKQQIGLNTPVVNLFFSIRFCVHFKEIFVFFSELKLMEFCPSQVALYNLFMGSLDPLKTEAKNLTEKESKNDHVKEEELGVSMSSPAPDYKPDKDDAEIAEVNKDVSASELGNVVETKTSSPNAETAMPELPKDQLEEDHADEFPFNMSDFVTVDELGDVTDLPDLAVPMETSDKRDAAPQTEQQEVYKVTILQPRSHSMVLEMCKALISFVITQLSYLQDTSGETTVTQEAESDEKVPESKHVSSQTPQTLNSLESGQDLNAAEPPTAASHIHMAPSEREGQPQPEASKDNINSEPGTTKGTRLVYGSVLFFDLCCCSSDIMLASSPDAEPISSSPPAVPAQSTSNSPAGAATAESDERKSRAVDHKEAQNEGLLKVSNKQVEEPMQDEEKTNQALGNKNENKQVNPNFSLIAFAL